jgi:hypothetical protein
MANWLERAKLEISKSAGGGTVNTVKRTLTSVTAVGKLMKSEAPSCFNCGAIMTVTKDITGRPLWVCKPCAVGDGIKPKVEPEHPPTDISEGRIVAVLIASEVLGADLWFALDDSFNPGDGLAVFYADELEFLKSKDAQTLRKIYETRLAFGPGSRVRQ